MSRGVEAVVCLCIRIGSGRQAGLGAQSDELVSEKTLLWILQHWMTSIIQYN